MKELTGNQKEIDANSDGKITKDDFALLRVSKAKGFNSIIYPGERKNNLYKKNLNKDISIPSNILKEMEELNVV